MSSKIRHLVSLSGGKDSTALAIFILQQYPELDVEYVFCDTGEELPETYQYIEKIETYLGKKINKVQSELSWDQWLERFSGYLPSARSRWCTANLKIKLFEKAKMYETINADGSKQNFTWMGDGSLDKVLSDTVSIKKRHAEYEKRVKLQKKQKSKLLLDVFSDDLCLEEALDLEDDNEGCIVCHL